MYKLKKSVAAIILIIVQIFFSGCGYTKADGEISLCVYADSRNQAAYSAAEKVAYVIGGYVVREQPDTGDRLALEQSARVIADSVLSRLGLGYKSAVICGGGTLTVKLGCGGGAAIKNTFTLPPDGEPLYKSVIADLFDR